MRDVPDTSWMVMACGVCGETWDEWHEHRSGRAVWSTSCKVDRAVSDWFRKIFKR